jgi:hypothetical protein
MRESCAGSPSKPSAWQRLPLAGCTSGRKPVRRSPLKRLRQNHTHHPVLETSPLLDLDSTSSEVRVRVEGLQVGSTYQFRTAQAPQHVQCAAIDAVEQIAALKGTVRGGVLCLELANLVLQFLQPSVAPSVITEFDGREFFRYQAACMVSGYGWALPGYNTEDTIPLDKCHSPTEELGRQRQIIKKRQIFFSRGGVETEKKSHKEKQRRKRLLKRL